MPKLLHLNLAMVTARALIALASSAAFTGCALVVGYGDPVEVTRFADAASDSGGPDDDGSAGRDAPPANDTAGAPFCESLSPRPTFCSSFDGPSLLAGWAASDVSNTRLERDTASWVSPPASLGVVLDRKTPDAGVVGSVSAEFAAFQGRSFTAKIGFDVEVDAAAPAGSHAVIATPVVIAAPGGPSYLLQMVCRLLADGSSVSVTLVEVKPLGGSPNADHAASESLTVKRWSRVELTFVLGATATTGSSARLLIDGRPAFEGPLVLPIEAGLPATVLGISTVAEGATAWALRYDNVTIDVQ